MSVYIFLVLLLLCYTYKTKSLNNSRTLAFFCLVLAFIAAFRGLEVGTDTMNYVERFYAVNQDNHLKLLEYGWYYLNLFLFNHSMSVRWVFIFTASILSFFVYLSVRNSSKWPLLSLLLYVLFFYYFESYNISRQVVAESIVLLAYSLIDWGNKKKIIIYYALIVLALFFHTSAIIAILLPFLEKVAIRKNHIIWIIIISLAIGQMALGDLVMSKSPSFLLDMYGHYFEDNTITKLSFTRILMNVYIIYIMYNKQGAFSVYDKALVMGIALQNAFPYPIVIRFFEYLIFASIIAIPNICKESRRKEVLLVTLLYGIVKFSVFLNANVSGVVPYSISMNFS